MSVSLPDRSSSRTNRHEGHDPRPRHQGDSHTRPGVFEPTAGIAHRAPRLGIFTPQNDSPQTAVAGFGRWVLSLGSIASELAGPGSMQILLGCMFLQVSICILSSARRARWQQNPATPATEPKQNPATEPSDKNPATEPSRTHIVDATPQPRCAASTSGPSRQACLDHACLGTCAMPCHATIVSSHVATAHVKRATPLVPRRHHPSLLACAICAAICAAI